MTASDDQGKTIAFLSDPASYGETGPVEQMETHGAIVFLVGERAYKLKKAVHYAYLDFSTLEKRRAVCEAELALNRRASPELYLETRAINRQPDGQLGFGPGDPVDWLVVMRRFASEALLSHVAERGALDEPLCRRLADRVAAFHEAVEPRHDVDGSTLIDRVIEGNAKAMAGLPLPEPDCVRLHERSRKAFDAVARLLDARVGEGHVARGHGDLHLANICLWNGEPLLFDCLEFDEALATVDLLYDLAFLLMDLIERGFGDQASWVFNRYLDRRGESTALGALPLFLSLRAGVRAHVEALRDETAGRAYLDAALGFLAPAPARLVAIGGRSGTGKSTLARALAPSLGRAPGARWLRTDVLRKRLAGVAPEERLPESAYTPDSHERVYAALHDAARAALDAGQAVIVDAVFDDAETREVMTSLARQCGVDFAGLWLEAPRDTLVERVMARRGDASDAGAAVVDKQLSRDVGRLGDWQAVDAGGSPRQTLASARALLGLPA